MKAKKVIVHLDKKVQTLFDKIEKIEFDDDVDQGAIIDRLVDGIDRNNDTVLFCMQLQRVKGKDVTLVWNDDRMCFFRGKPALAIRRIERFIRQWSKK